MPEAEGANSGVSSSLTAAIGIGTLTRLVPRELVDEVVLSLGRREQRNNKLPARVVVYFVMALALFYGDGYEEVIRKLADGLDYLGTWRRDWEVPTPGALCQARQPSWPRCHALCSSLSSCFISAPIRGGRPRRLARQVPQERMPICSK